MLTPRAFKCGVIPLTPPTRDDHNAHALSCARPICIREGVRLLREAIVWRRAGATIALPTRKARMTW